VTDPDREILRIGTRRSALALWQAKHVAAALRSHWGDQLEITLVEIVTQGDRILDRPLAEIGGKGLFVTEIEERLLSGDIDLAVHSMKDLPAQIPEELALVCTPPRADPRDALVGPVGARLAELPKGTRVGTSSLRRAALARRLNEGVEIVSIRGNVPTRVAKIEEGACDVVLLAAAGLRRLEMGDRISESLPIEEFCPAACQGILGLECRTDNERVRALLAPLHHEETGRAAAAERAFLERIEGGCRTPIACHARATEPGRIDVRGMVADPSGRPYYFAREQGAEQDAASLGAAVAGALLRLGGDRVIAALGGSI
jgi:hydroxymethylbilane synthase